MAGYSKKSLVEKLGIKQNFRILILDSPKDYFKTLGQLPKGIKIDAKISGNYDFIQFFTKEKNNLERMFPAFKIALIANGALWISWPKKSAKIETDINENIVRAIGIKNAMVDVKIAAVDDIWSGLKFVYRLKDR